jgi:hypothetical protein
MADVVRCLKQVEAMMHPLVPLKDQLAALAMVVQDQVQQTVALNLAIIRVEWEQRNGGDDRGHNNGCRHPGDGANDEEASEGLRTMHKMEFLKYDGVGDPLLWLNRCERYFRIRRTQEN